MKVLRLWFFVALLIVMPIIKLQAQAVGGNTVFNFLTTPYSAKATALGGVNISTLNSDLGLAMYNPALYDQTMDEQVHVSVKPFFAGIQQYDVNAVQFNKQRQWYQGIGVHYMNYGNIDMFDAAGNALGNMHPNEYAIQYSNAFVYKENFTLGSNVKFIQSNYGIYSSNALALDVGLNFLASSGQTQMSLLVNNIGSQLKTYGTRENLPFNITAGWSHKLETAPFLFSVTAQKLSIWELQYNDAVFNNAEGITSTSSSKNLFNHLVVSTELILSPSMHFLFGYNFLRRNDLNVNNQQNFLNGFSSGFEVASNRFTAQYGNAFYQRNLYHHIGIIYSLKKH